MARVKKLVGLPSLDALPNWPPRPTRQGRPLPGRRPKLGTGQKAKRK